MPLLAALLLRLIHILHTVYLYFASYSSPYIPQALHASRKKLPKHLALLLVSDPDSDLPDTEEALLSSIEKALDLSRAIGVSVLTVFDNRGLVSRRVDSLRERVKREAHPADSDNLKPEIEYPLTPPMSDCSDSRPLSPDLDMLGDLGVQQIHVTDDACQESSQSQPITINVLSLDSAKSAIAACARQLAHTKPLKADNPITVSIDDINSILEGPHGFSSPDLMILHSVSPLKHPLHTPAVELYGFPPWQIRLTEIYPTRRHRHSTATRTIVLDEIDYREALDMFSGVEMRLGR